MAQKTLRPQAKTQEDMNRVQQEMHDEFIEFQKNTTIELPAGFDAWKKQAMAFHSPSSMRVASMQFMELYLKKDGLNMLELSVLIPIMENKSMRQMDMDFKRYQAYQKEMFDLAVTFKETLQPEKDRITRKHAALNGISIKADA